MLFCNMKKEEEKLWDDVNVNPIFVEVLREQHSVHVIFVNERIIAYLTWKFHHRDEDHWE